MCVEKDFAQIKISSSKTHWIATCWHYSDLIYASVLVI